jgi:osmoprotectant transport system permease protein
VLWNALARGDVDAYVEYTGTLHQELVPGFDDDESLRIELARRGIVVTRPLGFNNTYAVGMKESTAQARGIATISALAADADVRLGFSNEFMDRGDGWPALRDRYGFRTTSVQGLDHDLAYRGLQAGTIHATDLYSTDAEVRYYGLRVLEDDRRYFPRYDAVVLYRADLADRAPEVPAALRRLEGAIPEAAMIAMNARVKLERASEAEAAAEFLRARLGVDAAVARSSRLERVARRTGEHLALVGISMAGAILLAVPLGIFAARRARLGQIVLAVTGVIQTIPALALLVFVIPLLGIGARPAIFALFLYSLLPIVRNTFAGLKGIPPELLESAAALGLPSSSRLFRVELPMASPSILAGMKTAVVINIGTATLGALIGAGGYGQPILTGIRLDDLGLILEGALPAAALALLAQGLFEMLERWVVPRGLRLPGAHAWAS